MPSYTFVAAGTISATETAAPGQPAGKAAGHLLLMLSCARAAAGTLNASPAGWTLLAETSSTTDDELALFGRIATNDASDNVSHDFWAGSTATRCQIAAFSGDVYTDLSTIVAHSAVSGSSSNTANIPNPAITITTDNCLVIGIGKKAKTTTSDGATFTSPAGLSNRIDSQWQTGTQVGFVWDYTQQTTAANISASVWTQSVAESLNYASVIVALKTLAAGTVWPQYRARHTTLITM